MTNRITHSEALGAIAAVMEDLHYITRELRSVGAQAFADVDRELAAEGFRLLASLVESRGNITPADILRRAADQVDPPEPDAEPDLTTPEGWIDEADRCGIDDSGDDPFGWSRMALADTGPKLAALRRAWHSASSMARGSAFAHTYVRSSTQ